MSHQKSLITGYWLKKTAQTKNGEVFYLANFLKPSSLECSLLLSSEELLPRGKEGDRLWRSFCNNDQIVIKRWPLIKENQTSQVKQFSVFLCMGRYKSLCSLKSFLFCASQLSGAGILFFPVLGPLRAHLQGRLQRLMAWWPQHPLLIRQATFYIHNRSKYNNNESLKYCENYHTVTQRQEVSKGCWKMALIYFCWVSQTFSL